MQTELLDNFYKLLESHEPENMQLAFEMAKGMELDWGREAYIGCWHLYQLHNRLYAQQHPNIPSPKDEDELIRIIRAVHRIKRLKLNADQLSYIPKRYTERMIQLDYIELRGVGDYSPLIENEFLHLRTKEFRIIGLELNEFPQQLQHFSNIHSLNLSKNKIQEIPNWIGNLEEIRILNLNFNQLASLPNEMAQLKHLRSLWLAGNQLSNLPDWLAELKELRYLYIFDNPGLSSEAIAALRAVMPTTCSIHGR